MARYHCTVVGRNPSKTEDVRLNSRTVSSGPTTTTRNRPHTMTVHIDLARLPHRVVQENPLSSTGGTASPPAAADAGGGGAAAAGGRRGAFCAAGAGAGADGGAPAGAGGGEG